jgi:hypothetical protein
MTHREEEEDDPSGTPLADPEEHPEQHAALQTERASEAAPTEGSDNTTFDTEEHSAEDGPFGTG